MRTLVRRRKAEMGRPQVGPKDFAQQTQSLPFRHLERLLQIRADTVNVSRILIRKTVANG